MSPSNALSTIAPSPVRARRTSWLARASLFCGLATPVVGVLVLSDVGSDFSDLLTFTLPLFMLAAIVLCILACLAIRKAPERLSGKGFAKAGAILATVTVGAAFLLVPAG